MTKNKKSIKGKYISTFLKNADKTIGEGIKNADKIIQGGIKNADNLLDTGIKMGIISAQQAKTEAKKFRKQAQRQATQLQKQAEMQAELIGNQGKKEIKKRLSKIKISPSRRENLRMLEKLGRLKKSGIITKKEFEEKKKKLLAGI